MQRWMKIMAIAVSIALLGSAIGFGAVLAADSAQQTTGQSPSDAYLGKLAARLGVTVDALKAALTQAQATTLDQLVSQGRLTAQQKQQIISQGKNSSSFGIPEFPGVTAQGQTAVSDMFLSNLAAALKTTVDKLKTAMTQAEIDVINDLAAQGKITDQQKQQMLARIPKDGDFLRLLGPGFAPGLSHGGRMGSELPDKDALLNKLASKLGITRQQLDDAISKAEQNMRSQPPTQGQPPASDAFLSSLATALNTTVDKLKAAMTQAETDVINDLAAQGKITDQQKQQMLERLQKGGSFPWLFGPPHGGRMGPGLPGDNAFLDKLASRLGTTRQKLDEAISQAHEDVRSQLKANAPSAGQTQTSSMQKTA